MRVALLSPLAESVPPKLYGGTERVIYNLCRGLVERGVDVTLFATGDSNIPGVDLVPVIPEALRLKSTPHPMPAAVNFKMISMARERLDGFDVVHNHNDIWMLPLSDLSATPMVSTLHGRLDFPDLAEALRGFPNARYISISNSQRTPLPDLSWVRTVHNGIDVKRLTFREEPGRYLAFLGRISIEKRPDLAIQIAKRAGVPLKIAAKIEGKEGIDYYNSAIRPHVDGRFIEFLGEIPDSQKSEFLSNALALVFPIDWPEPFGLVVIESIACGTPVLARPLGSIPELLSNGVTGFLDLDIQQLAKRVKDLDTIDRRACRAWAEAHFSYARMTENYLKAYRELINEREARRVPDLAERARAS